MVTAFVLLDITQDQIHNAGEALADLDGISEVHSVAGQYDLVAIVRVRSNDELARIVTEQIGQVDGIQRSETLIGFRVYSKHDLERLFSVGMEQEEIA